MSIRDGYKRVQAWFASPDDAARWILILTDERAGSRGVEYAFKVFEARMPAPPFFLSFFPLCTFLPAPIIRNELGRRGGLV